MNDLSSIGAQVYKLLNQNNLKGLSLLRSLSKKEERFLREKFSLIFQNGLFIPLDTRVLGNEYVYGDVYFDRNVTPQVDVNKLKYIRFDSAGKLVDIVDVLPSKFDFQAVKIIPTHSGFFRLMEPRSHSKNQMKHIIEKMERLRETQDILRRLKMKRGRSGPNEENEHSSVEQLIHQLEKQLHSLNSSPSCPKVKEFENYMRRKQNPTHVLELKEKFCERILEQESSKVIELLPGWYIHVRQIHPSKFYEMIEFICSHYPIAWLKKAGVKCVVSSAVCSSDKSESHLLQNVPAWQHVRIRMIDAWLRESPNIPMKDVRSLCDYMGILKSNEDALCQLHVK